MSICIPEDTDWSCSGWTEQQLDTLRYDGTDDIEKAETFAWMLLAALTAYQIGTCPVTVRPCAKRCTPAGGLSYGAVWPNATIGRFNPYISGGAWYNACGCQRSNGCECKVVSEVRLQGPVGGITRVMVDGDVVPADAYRAVGERLIRVDGGQWPICQDPTQSDEEGFSVTYYRGAAPNIMTRAAAGALAFEFYKGCKGEECRLPNNVIRASGGGLSYDMSALDVSEGASIPEVMAVVRIYNPYGLKTRPTVASPDSYLVG